MSSILFLILMTILWVINIKYTPKKISFYGYKTKRSMKNNQTWNYANKTANSLFGISILVSFLIYFVLFLIEIPASKIVDIIFVTFTILSILVVPITEYLLYNKYYRDK